MPAGITDESRADESLPSEIAEDCDEELSDDGAANILAARACSLPRMVIVLEGPADCGTLTTSRPSTIVERGNPAGRFQTLQPILAPPSAAALARASASCVSSLICRS